MIRHAVPDDHLFFYCGWISPSSFTLLSSVAQISEILSQRVMKAVQSRTDLMNVSGCSSLYDKSRLIGRLVVQCGDNHNIIDYELDAIANSPPAGCNMITMSDSLTHRYSAKSFM
jgi:hypothetical protein